MMIPREIWIKILEFTEDPSCRQCQRRYEMDMSHLQQHPITRSHRLPVQCTSCRDDICFDCVLRIHMYQMQMREGGFPGRPYVSCPSCKYGQAIRVSNPVVDTSLIATLARQYDVIDTVQSLIAEASRR
ncbi:hypothetical protein ACA910_015842 [Epithemia clementina (nom. ined.)]